MKINEIVTLPIPRTKINSKWIKGLKTCDHETLKSIGNMLLDIVLINFFLDLSPQARKTKAKTKK